MSFTRVPMRLPTGDCMIAAIATATGRTYEAISDILGISLDDAGRPGAAWWRDEPDGYKTVKALHKRLRVGGFKVSEANAGLSEFTKFAVATAHRPSILFIPSQCPADNGKMHVVAYVQGQVIDGRSPDVSSSLDDLDQVYCALVFWPRRQRTKRAANRGGSREL